MDHVSPSSTVELTTKDQEFTSLKQRQGPQTSAKRWTDEDHNPCVAEANASYRCLHETNFDKKSCQTYFVNYRNCQKYWMKVIRERQRLGIKPPLPLAEERAQMLQENGQQ